MTRHLFPLPEGLTRHLFPLSKTDPSPISPVTRHLFPLSEGLTRHLFPLSEGLTRHLFPLSKTDPSAHSGDRGRHLFPPSRRTNGIFFVRLFYSILHLYRAADTTFRIVLTTVRCLLLGNKFLRRM